MNKILDRIANLTEEERKAIANLPKDEKYGFFQMVEKCAAAEEENSKNYIESNKSAKDISARLIQLAQNFVKLSDSFKELGASVTNLADANQKLAQKDKQILEKTTETMGLCLKMISQSKRIAAQALEIYLEKADDAKLHQA